MLNSLTNHNNRIGPMSQHDIDCVSALEEIVLSVPQIDIKTFHTIHGGMYARTIMVPAGVVLTGAIIDLPTILIVHGEAVIYIDGKPVEFKGYHVIPASAHRKQVVVTVADTYFTMIFPTKASTVKEAEDEFTDDPFRLISRLNPHLNHITITGE